MRAVLMSIRPEWLEKILNGEKTIEIRKTCPLQKTPFKVYAYCTMATDPYKIAENTWGYLNCLFRNTKTGKAKAGDSFTGYDLGSMEGPDSVISLNGKIAAEFTCDRILTVDCDSNALFDKETKEYIDKETCVDRATFWNYTNGFCAYGWHISDLKAYDKPLNLSDISGMRITPNGFTAYKLHRAPQSWCYVEDLG